jgi:F-type H+-transporting ATPase subunit delta
MRNLKLIHAAFLDQVDARRGVVKAEVFSAQELGESERALLESGLAARTSLRIRPEYKIDSTLLGGVLVRMGSTVYDGSVRGMLAGLAAQAGAPV